MMHQDGNFSPTLLRQQLADTLAGGASFPARSGRMSLTSLSLAEVQKLLEQLRPDSERTETIQLSPVIAAELEHCGLIFRMDKDQFNQAREQIAGIERARSSCAAATRRQRQLTEEQGRLLKGQSSRLHQLTTAGKKLAREQARLLVLPALMADASSDTLSCENTLEKLEGLSVCVRSSVPVGDEFLRLSNEGRNLLQDVVHFQQVSEQLGFAEYTRHKNSSRRVFSAYQEAFLSLKGRNRDHSPALADLICEGVTAEQALKDYDRIVRSAGIYSIQQVPALMRLMRNHPEVPEQDLLQQHARLKDTTLLSLVLEGKFSEQDALEYTQRLCSSPELQIKTNAPALAGIGLSTGRKINEILLFHNSVLFHNLALVWRAAIQGSTDGIADAQNRFHTAPEVTPYYDHAFPLTMLDGVYNMKPGLLLAHYASLRSQLTSDRIDDTPGILAVVLTRIAKDQRKLYPHPDAGQESAAMFNPSMAIAWDLLDNGILDGSGLAIGGVL